MVQGVPYKNVFNKKKLGFRFIYTDVIEEKGRIMFTCGRCQKIYCWKWDAKRHSVDAHPGKTPIINYSNSVELLQQEHQLVEGSSTVNNTRRKRKGKMTRRNIMRVRRKVMMLRKAVMRICRSILRLKRQSSTLEPKRRLLKKSDQALTCNTLKDMYSSKAPDKETEV